MKGDIQSLRLWFRSGFFLLFVVAPPLDLFRLDLSVGHLVLFGHAWTLGIDPFVSGDIDSVEVAINIILRGLLPLFLIIGSVIYISWKYGRLYCGWLCPHFSVVEMINALLRRTIGKLSIWDREVLPRQLPDGREITPNRIHWFTTTIAVVGFALLWAVVLLTYLLPPNEIYHNLFHGELTRNQALFIGVATLLLSIEFLFARHLFCRFACAVGLFQSLAWMGNRRAMVVGFERSRVAACVDCNAACDNACPMRIKPRSIKRQMFTCTQCARCIEACGQVQQGAPSLLNWVADEAALDVSDREFGHKPKGGQQPQSQEEK